MANINFTEFDLRTSPLTGDFLVGYDESGSNEIRMEIKDVLSLVNSAKYESVYSSVNVTSANWDSVYSNVNSNSASWDSVIDVKYKSSTNYILQQSDVDSLLTFDTSTLTHIIIPTDSVLNVPIGSQLTVMRKGVGCLLYTSDAADE